MRRLIQAFGIFLAFAAMTACARPPQVADDPYMPEPVRARGDVPDYAELAQRYNRNLAHLDRLWSRSIVVMRWTDEDGRRHFEQGEGHFIFTEPDDVALTVGKLGNVMLWAGSNEAQYWMFDLRERGVMHHGRHENVGRLCSRELPLPVQPRTVPHLLGLLPLDETLADAAPPVRRVHGYDVIEPPGTRLRMMLHPDTALPVRVDLTNEAGEAVVIARLDRHDYMEVRDVAHMAGPRIATRATVHAVGEEAELLLTLSDMSDGRRFDRIDERVFDLDFLEQRHHTAEVIDLDAACP